MSEASAQSGDTLTYDLNLTVTGNSDPGLVVTDILPSGVSYVGPGTNTPAGLPTPSYNPSNSQLTWNLPSPLAVGSYQLAYQAQVGNLVAGGTTLMNNAQASSPETAPVSASVGVLMIGEYTVKIGVYNSAGELVESISSEELSHPLNNITLGSSSAITSLNGAGSAVTVYYDGQPVTVWNGLTSNGTPATNGGYYLQVTNVGSTGVVTSVTQQVTVNRAIEEYTIDVYNEAGEEVKDLYTFLGDTGPSGVPNMQLSSSMIEPGAPSGGTPSELTITLSNGTTVVWDGTSNSGAYVQSGQYFVEVHATDGNNAETTVVEQVSVENRGVSDAGTVAAWPNVVKPGSTTVTFSDNTSLNLAMRVSLYTVAGELFKVVEGDNGSNPPQWNAAGVASGLYFAVVEMRNNANNGLVGRQVVKVMVLH